MKQGTENRKKTIIAGALGMVALICVYFIYNQLFGGDTPAGPPPPPVITSAPSAAGSNASSGGSSGYGTKQSLPGGSAPGVGAVKLASTSASLDPTLDESAMLRTESLVYSGLGRNIFSATYTPPPPPIVKPKFPVRPVAAVVIAPPVPTGPPPPPPINLKFFGTAKRAGGPLEAFLLSGEDVYMAAEGDIVARKYKIGKIVENGVYVTDLQYNNTQLLPVQRN
jgi:hypothetical protein